jgi:hypothetical protein
MRSELVERAGVAAENLAALGFRQRRLEGKPRIVEIPMRIIRREQQPIDTAPFDQRAQISVVRVPPTAGWISQSIRVAVAAMDVP